jgi:hypothetical protein
LDACRSAEVALGEQPDSGTDEWRDEWLEVQVERVWAHYWLAQWQEMNTLVDFIRPVVEAQGSTTHRMRFLMASCLMHLRRERYVVSDEMVTDSREALEASQNCGSMKTRIECLFELGFLHLWRRELDEAEKFLREALTLTETAGVLPTKVIILTYLTVLCRFQGN